MQISMLAHNFGRPKFSDTTLVPAPIAYSENDLKSLAKAAGERLNSEKRAWLIV